MMPQKWRIKWKRTWNMKWEQSFKGGIWGFPKLGHLVGGPNTRGLNMFGSTLGI